MFSQPKPIQPAIVLPETWECFIGWIHHGKGQFAARLHFFKLLLTKFLYFKELVDV